MTATPTPDITITRRLSAPPAAVFEAWTDPAQFASWFGTSQTTVKDVSIDLRVGGTWSARMVLGDGSAINWHGSYSEVDPPRRLVLTLSDRPGDDYELVTVDLVDRDGETEMTFTQSGGHMSVEEYGEAERGWQGFFDDLESGLVEAGTNAAQ